MCKEDILGLPKYLERNLKRRYPRKSHFSLLREKLRNIDVF